MAPCPTSRDPAAPQDTPEGFRLPETTGWTAAGSPAGHGAGCSRSHCPHGKIGPEEGALPGVHRPGAGARRTQEPGCKPSGWDEGWPEHICSLAVQSGLRMSPVSEGTAGTQRLCARTLGGHALSPPPHPGRPHRTPPRDLPGLTPLCPQCRPGTLAPRPVLPPLLCEGTLARSQLSVHRSCMLKGGCVQRGGGGLPPRWVGPAEALSRVAQVKAVPSGP